MRVLDQVDILSLNDISIVPVAEELDIRHQVNVGLPEAVFSLLVLVNQIKCQSKLFPVAFFFAREKLRVLGDDRAKDLMAACTIDRHEHLVRNG